MYRGTNTYLKPYFDTSPHLNSLFSYAKTTDKPSLVFELILDLPFIVNTSHSYSSVDGKNIRQKFCRVRNRVERF